MENVKRYQVELTGSLTFETSKGEKFQRGQSKIITKESDVAYYKSNPEFLVTRLRDPKPVAAVVAPKSIPPKAASRSKAPPPPVVEEDEDEDDIENSEDDEDDEEESDSDEDPDEDSDDEEDDDSDEEEDADESGPAVSTYSKTQLLALTKPAIVELGKQDFNLRLDVDDNKTALVSAVLQAQIAAVKASKNGK